MRPERDAYHLLPPSAEVKKECGYISFPSKGLSCRVAGQLFFNNLIHIKVGRLLKSVHPSVHT